MAELAWPHLQSLDERLSFQVILIRFWCGEDAVRQTVGVMAVFRRGYGMHISEQRYGLFEVSQRVPTSRRYWRWRHDRFSVLLLMTKDKTTPFSCLLIAGYDLICDDWTKWTSKLFFPDECDDESQVFMLVPRPLLFLLCLESGIFLS